MANETNLKFESEELEAEEVNVYSDDCGALKACQTDCPGESCWLTCSK